MKNNFLSVPYDIFSLKGLTLSAKILLAEIISLSKLEGYCYASNEYLAERLGISYSTAKKSIQLLKKKGYITSKTLNFNERFLYPSQGKIYPTPGAKKDNPPGKKGTGGRSKNSHNNNIYNNKDNINITDRKNDYYMQSKPSYDIEELMKIK